MSHRIVFLDRATIAPQIRVRPPSFAHELIEHAETAADQVAERLAGASIAITNKAPISAATLARLPALKLIAVAATGTDCVDQAACAARGVASTGSPGVGTETGAGTTPT
jgi:glycerate dehydrogenase